MDHIRIIRRAFEIVRSYRVLWIFGFLIALTSAGGSNPNPEYQFNQQDFRGNFPLGFSWHDLPQGWQNGIIGIGIGAICLLLLLAVAFTIVRYVAETSAIRIVDRYESTGEKVSFREGWRLGWSRAAFRMWLVDLVFGLGVMVVFLAMLAVAAAPFLVWTTGNNLVRVLGTVTGSGLVLLVILLLILVSTVLSLLGHFFHRAIALEDLGVFDGIRRGWAIVRRRPGDVIILGLILFGLGLVFAIVMIPVGLALLVVAGLAGGLPGLLAGFVTNFFAQGPTSWIVGLAVGIPIFFLILSVPMAFLGGLMQAFTSSSWTLAYREMVALETIQPVAVD